MLAEGKGSDVMVSWEELRIMQESGLIDIQSHTHAHIRWDKEFREPEELFKALKEDLLISKREIEGRLKKDCTALSWPWGKYNDQYITVARDVGFCSFYTTEKGTNCTHSDLMRLKRIVIGNISTLTLRKKLIIYSDRLFSKMYVSFKR